MRKGFRHALKTAQAIALSAVVLTGAALPASAAGTKAGQWVAGDFHTHTYLSDGSYTAAEVAAKAKAYGLDWYSAADHGGSSVGTRDKNGNAWTGTEKYLVNKGTAEAPSYVMPRWASILGIGQDEIDANRKNGILQFTGFEWNVPTHEHASVGIVGGSDQASEALAVFDYMFDGTAEALIPAYEKDSEGKPDKTKPVTYTDGILAKLSGIQRSTEGKSEELDGSKKLTNNTHNGALAGAAYLQRNFPTTSYFLPNHPSRQLKYTAADFKEFYDAAPDVVFGAELLPGHQASAFRGGLGYFTYYDTKLKKLVNLSKGDATTLEGMVDAYLSGIADPSTVSTKAEILASLNELVPKQRTYGGADYMLAKVGGVWDTLLSEGRRFWAFGNSDFHIDSEKAATKPGSEPDFWPGEYSKNYTYVAEKSYQGILDGMRSGNSFAVLGDLINALDYTVSNNGVSATMGESLTPVKDADTVVTVRFKSPAANNNGDAPKVDHIDLIAGEVKGEPAVKFVDSSKTSISNFEDPKQYLTEEYQNGDVTATTKVIKTFTKNDWTVDKDGYNVVTFTLPASDKDMYYRLRGTNLAPSTSGETDAAGNPLIDTPVSTLVGTNTTDKAYDDLWFYSNPVFVTASIDGVTVNGKLTDANGAPLANTKLRLDYSADIMTTDGQGRFTASNIGTGIHTLYLLDNAGNETGKQLSFKIDRGDKTEVDGNDVLVAAGVTAVDLTFKATDSGIELAAMAQQSQTTERQSGGDNPATGEPLPAAVWLFGACGIVLVALLLAEKHLSRKNGARSDLDIQ